MKYFTRVAERETTVELTEDGVRIDGRTLEAELATLPDGGRRHLRLGSRGHAFSAARVDGGWEIRMEGHVVVVQVEDERTHRIRELARREPPGAGGGRVEAPMPGKVVRILVEEGQLVEPGTALLTMEAMKMENELRARRGGRVGSIRVSEGETVNQDAVLMELDPAGDDSGEGDDG